MKKIWTPVGLALKGTVCLGLLGMALFTSAPYGINVLGWVAALHAMTYYTMSKAGVEVTLEIACWMLCSMAGAVGISWRMSPTLTPLNLGVVMLGLLMVAWNRSGQTSLRASAWEMVSGLSATAAQVAIGSVRLLTRDAGREAEPASSTTTNSKVIARGVALATPFVAVFFVLFARADSAFLALAKRVYDLSFDTIWSGLVTLAATVWIAGGLLRSYLVAAPAQARPPKIYSITFGAGELSIALGLVNLLFAVFVLVQMRYLFGGASLVELDPDLTYSTYARRGFFELVAAAAIVLPMLLVMDAVMAPSASKKTFRSLCLLLLAFLVVVLFSAWTRMRLYQAEYGQTELRFYVVAFMVWLAAVCLWFAVTVVPGRAQRFPLGLILLGIVAVATLNGVNPDPLILQQNVDRIEQGKSFDVRYAATLSPDAVPEFIRLRAKMDPAHVRLLAKKFSRKVAGARDFRGWNHSRWTAATLLDQEGANDP